MDLEKIQKICEKEMKEKSSHSFKEKGNKYYHGIRVAKIITKLCGILDYRCDMDVLTVAAWYHDICNGVKNHEQLGADKTYDLLKDLCTEQELSTITYLISVHDSRKRNDLSMEAKILQDADFLDHFGTFEVWCTFQYAIHDRISMQETADMLFYNYNKEFTEDRNKFHFDISKKIYDEKRNYSLAFTKRMQDEAAGNIVNLDFLSAANS